MASSAPNVPKIISFDELLLHVSKKFGFVPDNSLKRDLRDLWRMGAPIPQSGPGAIEKRVLLPSQFRAWWKIAVQKYGEPV